MKKLGAWQLLLIFFLFLSCSPQARSDAKSDSHEIQNSSAYTADIVPTPTDTEIEKSPRDSNPSSVAPDAPKNIAIQRVKHSREILETKGFESHGFLKTEGTTDFRSGLSADGTDFRGLLETSVSLDLDKAFRWKGARISASFHDYFGTDATDDLIRDAQGFSNIDAQPLNRMYELWFEQSLANGKVRIKLGRIDANTEFAFVENAGEFLNSSMGYSPTILDMHSYPEPQPGAVLAMKTGDFFSLTVGDFLCPMRGDMALGEIGTRWKLFNGQAPGRIAFGSWIHPHTLTGNFGNEAFGLHGYYAIGEQMLWKTNPGAPDDARGIRAFVQWGSADPTFSGISRHEGGGAEWIGPFSRRSSDVAGLGITAVRLGQDSYQGSYTGHEQSIESFYKVSVRSWMSITADLQFINSSNAQLIRAQPYVGNLRMTLIY